MKTIDLAEISALESQMQPGSKEPVVVTRDGKPMAAVVPVDEEDLESLLLSVNPRFQAILERSALRLKSEGGLSSDQVRRELGLL